MNLPPKMTGRQFVQACVARMGNTPEEVASMYDPRSMPDYAEIRQAADDQSTEYDWDNERHLKYHFRCLDVLEWADEKRQALVS